LASDDLWAGIIPGRVGYYFWENIQCKLESVLFELDFKEADWKVVGFLDVHVTDFMS